MLTVCILLQALLCKSVIAWTNGASATGPTDPSVVDHCEYWVNNIGLSDSCELIEDYFGITRRQFRLWNPSLSPSCVMTRGWSYCVAAPSSATTSTTSTTSITATRPSDPPGTITYSGTAAPTQSGVSSSCAKYHLVHPGDTCYTIQDEYGDFTLEQFYSWNPSIGKGCIGIQPGYYVCVGTESKSTSISMTPTTGSSTAIPSKTSEGSSASDPQPHQTGIPANCNKWHYVVDGDECETIATKYGITLQQFYTWNPAIGSTCRFLWKDNYVCVGITDITRSTIPPTSTAHITTSSAVATPTLPTTTAPSPIQPGTPTDCVSYYEVQPGDDCWGIINKRFTYLTEDQFIKWNPAVGSSCKILLGYHYCVAVKTAQPMPDTIDTCKKWHLTEDGDGCWQIQHDFHISPDDFNKWNPHIGADCHALWLGYYICIGV
ncbi:hypothetical protein BDV35DRAFT_231250 [Aspergillus flavus]|uniref:Peptidoglycan-binding lysin domain-containing protein n=3 Tax=Aspergillus subgen. Circumdati TaxID=2720871 RepID=A0A1S9DG64_ASPOZ|nr:hypothetical protein BDV35DRAFT_231250 [Aspergillus flavus]KDE78518.1 LysM domain protein [Aspergillus oryzae 100-8]OOO08072.1 Peptidoglycan-binding lysin domain-containing protein [Aspergillus oryzae]